MDVVVFAKALYKELREREANLSGALSQGNVQDYAQYMRVVGEIQGLAYSREFLRALLEKNADDVEEIISS
jgi:hypothetical protein|tara:strand:+ start:207 stop:419 length:213 start_codon:yes stop_codon:yes gene_type:complete